jgi:hypothetical protein
MKSWISDELKACSFADVRLAKRFETLVEQFSVRMGQSIPLACQDWTNTKAAYRFFANERVSEVQILQGHFQATQSRFSATEGPILVVHDTTEFSYQREEPQAVGITTTTHSDLARKRSRPRPHTVCGLLMHSSLAVTTDGVPLGLTAIKFWSRKKFKGTNRLKRKINPTRVPVEQKESIRWIESLKQSTTLLGDPDRCVRVGDRESDMRVLLRCAGNGGSFLGSNV